MDSSTVIALLANAGALPKGIVWRVDYGDDERDAYGKAVDLLDSLGVIQSVDVNRIGEPYEILHVEGGLDISGPRGFMPVTATRETTPTEDLAGAVLPVVSEEDAEAVLNWARHKVSAAKAERVMPGAANELASEKAARVVLAVLADDGHALVAAPVTGDEDPEGSTVVTQFPRRLRAVTQPHGEGA